ncbi:hypothetical protein [Gymnodinialimonas sp. 57CJ19]
MTLRPILFAALLAAAPVAALAQNTPTCDPSTTSCPSPTAGGTAGVNVDP